MVKGNLSGLVLALCCGLLPAAGAAQDLVVAQIASQSSTAAGTIARGMYGGIRAYFDSVNAQGGVNGRPVKLLPLDDQVDAAKMVAMTRELIANKEVLALVGFLNTGGLTELSKQDIPGQGGIALIAPLQGNKNIVSAANFFPFRSGFTEEVGALVNEAKNTRKERVAIFYYTSTFGPSMSQFALAAAKKQGLNIVANIGVDTLEKFEPNMKAGVAELVKANPDAVLLICAGRCPGEFVRLVKDTPAAPAQIYAMSVAVVDDIIKAAGTAKARGVVIAQALPFPFSPTLPVVAEYRRLMKQYASDEPISFASLEGFIGAKITVEALRRASPNPTREKVLKALSSFGEWNVGGVYVNYTPQARIGWNSVDLTIIDAHGKLLR
jgi:branched-chain amino acid transport system substrate-binding protein